MGDEAMGEGEEAKGKPGGSQGEARGRGAACERAALVAAEALFQAHDMPALARQHLAEGSIKLLPVGRGDVEAEGVIAAGHDLAANLQARAAREALEQLPVAVLHGPDPVHFLGTSAPRVEDACKMHTSIVRRNEKWCTATIRSLGVAAGRDAVA